MQEAYIVAGFRTAVGKAKRGGFRFYRPDDLAVDVIQGLMASVPQLEAKRGKRQHRDPQAFSNIQSPDHERLPWRPEDSGKSAKSRNKSVSRFSFAAVLSSERTLAGFQPQAMKNPGPSSGANLNGAPISLKRLPVVFCIIFNSPGEHKSISQR